MKPSKLCILGSLALVASLCSCESKSQLAKNLEGTWSTNTRSLVTDTDALRTSAIDMIQFNMPDGVDNPISGPLTLTSMVEVTTAAPASDEVVQPYTVSVSGIVSIEGEWIIADHDEVTVNLNQATFNVQIDPADVVMEDNLLTGENYSVTDSVKPALAEAIKQQISSDMLEHFLGIRKIDDIHIDKSGEMKCEINDTDYILHRQ